MKVWKRINDLVTRYYAPWMDIPVHSLMVSGAQLALYALQEKLREDDFARLQAGKRPRHMEVVNWIDEEVSAMLAADEARVKAKVSVGERSR